MRALVWLATGVAMIGCSPSAAKTDALPPFALTNQSGQVVRTADLRGYATVVSFIFTSCRDVCPLVTAQLTKVQARATAAGLGGKLRFVSITVDPATDTPDVLKRYATGYGVDLTTWHFLTGASSDISLLTRELGVVTSSGTRIGHTNLVLFVDGQGQIVERYTGLDLEPERVLPKLRRILG